MRGRRAAVVVLLGVGSAIGVRPSERALSDSPSVHIRVNQVGYRPADPKVGLALTSDDLGGKPFEVRAKAGEAVALSGRVGRDRGRYGAFAHVYELDFSPLATSGSYFVRIGKVDSPV